MANKTAEATTKVVTGKVRFSYAHVHEPHAIEEGQTKKYSVSILIPKKDKATLNKINNAIGVAYEQGKSENKLPTLAVCKTPLRDGDEEKPDNEEYEGMMFMNASSYNKPQIVDENTEPIMSKEQFYSGCFGRASVNFYAYGKKVPSKGIACGLNNLQFLEDGENLAGSGSSAADDFAEEDSLY